MNEHEAFAVLTSIPGLGAIKIRQLVQQIGSATDALHAAPGDIRGILGCDKLADSWSSWQDNTTWQRDLALASQAGVQLIPYTHPLFPKSLLETHDHPALLYVQGTLKPQDAHSIAVVGTRYSGIYGNEMAATISRELAANGFTVISGLARGVDTAAHHGALEKGRTIAVIGSGLADIYPKENKDLARIISVSGALISEFPMITPPDRQNFPQRNRIVSGMSLATLLIEAPIKSGAMITMEKAFNQKRKLFALPGRADSENFRGNHALIKNGRAQLVESATDIISHFDDFFPALKPQSFDTQRFYLDNQEQRLLKVMPSEEIGIDFISSLVNLPIHQTQALLMGLVLKKVVKEFPGKIYKKISAGSNIKSHH
ncbi:MAG: DNA-processing protein DprA [Parachlamydiaceae bacterium]